MTHKHGSGPANRPLSLMASNLVPDPWNEVPWERGHDTCLLQVQCSIDPFVAAASWHAQCWSSKTLLNCQHLALLMTLHIVQAFWRVHVAPCSKPVLQASLLQPKVRGAGGRGQCVQANIKG